MYIIEKCPYCGGEVAAGARKCRHCGEWLTSDRNKEERTVVVNNVRKTNGIGTAGFVLAILSLCLSWTPLAGFFVWFLGFLLSFIGMFKSPRGLAVAGFIISIAGFLILIFAFGALAVLFAAFA